MEKKLSIAICVYNKYNFTKACINDLSKLTNDHEIIIVDNGSTDETSQKLENSNEIKYIKNKVNGGFAKGSNLAFSHATSDKVLFLNNDIRVKENHSNWTQSLIDNCVDDILCGPTMGLLDDNLNFVTEANRQLPGKSYLSGWCIAGNRNTWGKLDLGNNQIFSEEFFCYFEDTDLSFRAKKLNIKLLVLQVPVIHFGKISSNQLNTHQLYCSARKIFINKWAKLIKN